MDQKDEKNMKGDLKLNLKEHGEQCAMMGSIRRPPKLCVDPLDKGME